MKEALDNTCLDVDRGLKYLRWVSLVIKPVVNMYKQSYYCTACTFLYQLVANSEKNYS